MPGVSTTIQPAGVAYEPDEPRYELYVASRRMTHDVSDLRLEYDMTGGGATLSFTSRTPLDGMAGRDVRLEIGYADELTTYFLGRLSRIVPPSYYSGYCSAVAQGPYALMATQYFGEQVTYDGYTLSRALYDIAMRATYSRGEVVVRGGENVHLVDATFTEETSLAEGAQSLLDANGWVGVDMPGGTRQFMAHPQPGQAGRMEYRFTPKDYPAGGMTVTDLYGVSYSKVVVFRRNDGTNSTTYYDVYESAPVPANGWGTAPRNSIYYVTDFPGDAAEAKRRAYELAQILAAGQFTVELSGVAIRPEVGPYGQIAAVRRAQRRDGVYDETYHVVVDGSLSLSVSDWTMDISGTAILVDEKPYIETAEGRGGTISSGVVTIPGGHTVGELASRTVGDLSNMEVGQW